MKKYLFSFPHVISEASNIKSKSNSKKLLSHIQPNPLAIFTPPLCKSFFFPLHTMTKLLLGDIYEIACIIFLA